MIEYDLNNFALWKKKPPQQNHRPTYFIAGYFLDPRSLFFSRDSQSQFLTKLILSYLFA